MTEADCLALMALVRYLVPFATILISMVILLPLRPNNLKITFGKVKIEASFEAKVGE